MSDEINRLRKETLDLYAAGCAESERADAAERKFDFVGHLKKQSAFSARAFGPGPRTVGIVNHIRKELEEVLANPRDIMEWIDVMILASDGALREGFTPEEVAHALATKLAINEQRAADVAGTHRSEPAVGACAMTATSQGPPKPTPPSQKRTPPLTPAGWEIIDEWCDEEKSRVTITDRMSTPDGWIVRVYSPGIAAFTVTYVPDEHHQWRLTK